MPKFKYTAVSRGGENIVGDYTAPDENSVMTMLRQSGYYATNVEIVAEDVGRVSKRKVKPKVLAGFCMQMSSMIRAGVPITRTLGILSEEVDNDNLRKIIADVHKNVLQGVALSVAFGEYRDNFPQFFHSMIEAGEASGTLDTCLNRAGITFSQSYKLNAKVKNAMIYPAVLGTLAFGVVVIMLVFVIPQFAQLYADNNAELPMFTQLLLGASDFMVNYWYIFAGLIVLFSLAFHAWISTDGGRTKFDQIKIKIPAVKKLMLRVYASRFARSLSAFIMAGVPMTKGLEVTARSISNRYIEKQLYGVVEGVTQGKELSSELESIAVFPSMIVYLTKLGEESGTLDELMTQAADYFDNESESSISALTALMEPLLIIVMAAIVIPIIVAIILPVFNMYGTMV
jgi:type IV pilus assembly protein PilC